MQLWNIHGTYNLKQENSPIGTYSCTFADIFPFYPFHWHEELEILLVKGSLTARIDGESVDLSNCIAVLPPYCLHKLETTDNNVSVLGITLNFRLATDEKFYSTRVLAPFFNNKFGFLKICAESKKFEFLETRFNSVWHDDTKIAELDELLKFFADNRTDHENSLSQQKKKHSLRLAIEYITSHFNFDIDDLAKHIGYSKFYTIKLFNEFAGISPVEYSNRFRLTLATNLLKTTKNQVKDIALQVGYSNISYFNRQFLKLYGCTPQEFRNKNLK